MKTADAVTLAGSKTELAAIFGITLGAVSQWGDELPRGRYFELRALRPRWFDGAGNPRMPAKAEPDAETRAA